MIPGERCRRAGELLGQAIEELELAAEDAPAYSVEALAFLRAEIKVSIRRLGNVAKVLGSTRRG